MAVQLASRPDVLDVLDRVLDKGIVIDAWMRVGLVGIDPHLLEIESRMVVASIDTYLRHLDALADLSLVAPPRLVKRPKRKPAARFLARGLYATYSGLSRPATQAAWPAV